MDKTLISSSTCWTFNVMVLAKKKYFDAVKDLQT